MHWQDFSVFGDCLFEGGDVCEMCGISGFFFFSFSKGITTQLRLYNCNDCCKPFWGFSFLPLIP